MSAKKKAGRKRLPERKQFSLWLPIKLYKSLNKQAQSRGLSVTGHIVDVLRGGYLPIPWSTDALFDKAIKLVGRQGGVDALEKYFKKMNGE